MHSTISLAKTLDSPSIEANAKVQIIRTFTGCNGVRDKGKEGLSFWYEELNSQVVSKTTISKPNTNFTNISSIMLKEES